MFKQLELVKHSDNRGDLYVLEDSRELNFDFQRYHIFNNKRDDIIELNYNKAVVLVLLSGEVSIIKDNVEVVISNVAAFEIFEGEFIIKILIESNILIMSNEIYVHINKYAFNKIDIPFNSKRIFVVKNVPIGSHRGQHAHKTESQYLISVTGRVEVELSGYKHEKKYLEPFDSILLPPLLWTDLRKFERETVLLVFASSVFIPDEYIINKEDVFN